MTFQASSAIKEAAILRGDKRIIRKVQARLDSIAAETKYHRSCYAAYTDKRAFEVAQEDAEEESDRNPYQRAFLVHLKTRLNER